MSFSGGECPRPGERPLREVAPEARDQGLMSCHFVISLCTDVLGDDLARDGLRRIPPGWKGLVQGGQRWTTDGKVTPLGNRLRDKRKTLFRRSSRPTADGSSLVWCRRASPAGSPASPASTTGSAPPQTGSPTTHTTTGSSREAPMVQCGSLSAGTNTTCNCTLVQFCATAAS